MNHRLSTRRTFHMGHAIGLSLIAAHFVLGTARDSRAVASNDARPTPFTSSTGLQMLPVPAGSFRMGSRSKGDFDERPAHRVRLTNGFFLSETEVTNRQFEQFDPTHRSLRGTLGFSQKDDEAVVMVTWNQAVAFCQWLTRKERRSKNTPLSRAPHYRLPTEAEWEYACRAGTTTSYHTGNELPAEFHKNVRNSWYPAPTRSTAKEVVSLFVGRTQANAWGLKDMHGNVEEWCQDWYGPYPASDQIDPVGPDVGDFRTTRGGSHQTLLAYLRSANRSGTLPEDRSWLIGFRVAFGPPSNSAPQPPSEKPLHQQNVLQRRPPIAEQGPARDRAYFRGPLRYVDIPEGSRGPLFSQHNHDPALVDCPNGDLLAIWYTCLTEPGRELGVAASRLRYGQARWEPASVFWNAPDRNDHAPALWSDEHGTLYHFNGLSAAGTWGSLATVLRTSSDSGATWSKARLIFPDHGIRQMPVESVISLSDHTLVLPCDAVPGGGGGTSIKISKDKGRTWHDPSADTSKPTFVAGGTGGSIAGIHGGVVELKDSRLYALGRGDNLGGRMPCSISSDGGRTWRYRATELPPIGGNQRLALLRLSEGPLLLVSFTHDFFKYRGKPDSAPPVTAIDSAGHPRRIFGMFAALSTDEGDHWKICKPISPGDPARTLKKVTLTGDVLLDATHAEPRGYLSICQTPDGVIHLISSGLYYAFNLAWVQTPIGAGRLKPDR